MCRYWEERRWISCVWRGDWITIKVGEGVLGVLIMERNEEKEKEENSKLTHDTRRREGGHWSNE